MTKQDWAEIIHEARRNGDFSETIDPFFGGIETDGVFDSFLFDCLIALKSSAGNDFAEILNQNKLKGYKPKHIWEKWNNPKSPVRNFLLVRHIDYPLKKDKEIT